jgi:CRP-like cAMP-binding protein
MGAAYPVIRNILGQVKCKVNFPFMMDNRRIFIANLSKGKIGHDKANLLGSLLVAQFQQAAMRRADQPEHERRDFFLFIDEFQNFTTNAFTSLLDGRPRSATAVAVTTCELVPIDLRRFLFLVQQTPHFALQMMSLMAARLRRMDAQFAQED